MCKVLCQYRDGLEETSDYLVRFFERPSLSALFSLSCATFSSVKGLKGYATLLPP